MQPKLFTSFAQASPPKSGWYWLKWNAECEARQYLLTHTPPEPQDDPVAHDVYNWTYQLDSEDDPESLALDVPDPTGILWRSVTEALPVVWTQTTFQEEELLKDLLPENAYLVRGDDAYFVVKNGARKDRPYSPGMVADMLINGLLYQNQGAIILDRFGRVILSHRLNPGISGATPAKVLKLAREIPIIRQHLQHWEEGAITWNVAVARASVDLCNTARDLNDRYNLGMPNSALPDLCKVDKQSDRSLQESLIWNLIQAVDVYANLCRMAIAQQDAAAPPLIFPTEQEGQ